MTYITSEARQDMLDDIGRSVDEIAVALAALGGAYELLDEATADRLEEELFRPVQVAYGRAKRTYTSFAGRYDLTTRPFVPAEPGAPSHGVKVFVENALDAVQDADEILAEIQDSMMPVEVGDQELRAGLADVREHLGGLGRGTRDFLRTLGR
jgi:hypothetical protein